MCHPVLMLRKVHSTTWSPPACCFVCHSAFVRTGRYFEIVPRCRVVPSVHARKVAHGHCVVSVCLLSELNARRVGLRVLPLEEVPDFLAG